MPLGAEPAPREELQHAGQQHIPADQHRGGMLGLPLSWSLGYPSWSPPVRRKDG
jgi:hypothetical protein